MESIPLNAQLQASRPKISPRIECQRFWPVYGKLDGAPSWQNRFDGEYTEMPIKIPKSAATAPSPEAQITIRAHTLACFRNGVK
jgi:hypothetical protein